MAREDLCARSSSGEDGSGAPAHASARSAPCRPAGRGPVHEQARPLRTGSLDCPHGRGARVRRSLRSFSRQQLNPGTVGRIPMPREPGLVQSEMMSLTERDFDPSNSDARGIERLHELCEDLAGHSVAVVAPVVLGFIEKFANPVAIDARWDLGTPGPLVHALEALPGFEPFLVESLQRRPAPLSVWMLNRLLNALPSGDDHDRYLALLRSIRDRGDVSSATAAEAADFLEYQRRKRDDSSPSDA